MTSPEVPSDDNDLRTWEHVPRVPTPNENSASLLDADDQALSKGAAVLYRDERKALFYPHDLAQLNTIRTRAKTLFLTSSRESLSIREIEACQGQCGGLVHWHMRLT